MAQNQGKVPPAARPMMAYFPTLGSQLAEADPRHPSSNSSRRRRTAETEESRPPARVGHQAQENQILFCSEKQNPPCPESPLFPRVEFSGDLKNGDGSITIKKATNDDSGVYSCDSFDWNTTHQTVVEILSTTNSPISSSSVTPSSPSSSKPPCCLWLSLAVLTMGVVFVLLGGVCLVRWRWETGELAGDCGEKTM
ncbi:unnamed protein product [Lampetra fluviatilis]